MWQNSADLVSEPDDDSGLIATFVLEGQGSIRVDGPPLILSRGDGVTTDSSSILGIESTSPLAILGICHGGRSSERFGSSVLAEPRRVAAAARPVRTVLVLANMTLANSYPDDSTWHLKETAAENMMAAVIIDADEGERAPEKDEISRRAMQIISARSPPRIGFGITEPADEMRIPIRTLQELFANNDTTARWLLKHDSRRKCSASNRAT